MDNRSPWTDPVIARSHARLQQYRTVYLALLIGCGVAAIWPVLDLVREGWRWEIWLMPLLATPVFLMLVVRAERELRAFERRHRARLIEEDHGGS